MIFSSIIWNTVVWYRTLKKNGGWFIPNTQHRGVHSKGEYLLEKVKGDGWLTLEEPIMRDRQL